MSVEIPVYRRARGEEVAAVAVVDDADGAALLGSRWLLAQSGCHAMRVVHYRDEHDRWTSRRVYLHREVMGLAHRDRRQVGHRDGDGLNNVRSNLVVAPSSGARGQMRRGNKLATSRYRGVSWSTCHQRWLAKGETGGRVTYLGVFTDERLAGLAASDWRRIHLPHSQEAQMPLVPDVPEGRDGRA